MVHISPKTYGKLYRVANNETLSDYIISLITDVMEKKLMNIISTEKPDLIIATHSLVANVLGTLKGQRIFDTSIISIVTDYMIHRTYINNEVDAYVVGSEYTKNDMIDKGIDANRIHSYGIPVKKSFLDYSNKANKDWDVDLTVLLMAGSMGTLQMEKAFANLIQSKYYLKIIVVCGNNEKVKKRILKISKEYPIYNKYDIYGFVDNIPELMDNADIIITKPGGLTTTESIIKKIPIIIPYYIPGQEEENADFLVNKGMALKVDKIDKLVNIVDYLVENKEVLNTMSKKMYEVSKNQSMDKILKLSNSLIKEKILR